MHLHREKYITKGGPDGGDGGRGGHVILRGDKNLWTLFHLKFKKHFRAEEGGGGSKSKSTGKDAADIYVDVPLGTIIRDGETQETGILKHPQIKRLAMPNPELKAWKVGFNLN